MFLGFLFSNGFKVQINPPEMHNIPSTDLAGITPVEKFLNSTPFRGQSKNTTVRKSMYRTVGGLLEKQRQTDQLTEAISF